MGQRRRFTFATRPAVHAWIRWWCRHTDRTKRSGQQWRRQDNDHQNCQPWIHNILLFSHVVCHSNSWHCTCNRDWLCYRSSLRTMWTSEKFVFCGTSSSSEHCLIQLILLTSTQLLASSDFSLQVKSHSTSTAAMGLTSIISQLTCIERSRWDPVMLSSQSKTAQ